MADKPDKARPINFWLGVAVGMGVPFRMLAVLFILPFWVFVFFVMVIMSPRKEANSLISDPENYWHWIWHGEKKW